MVDSADHSSRPPANRPLSAPYPYEISPVSADPDITETAPRVFPSHNASPAQPLDSTVGPDNLLSLYLFSKSKPALPGQLEELEDSLKRLSKRLDALELQQEPEPQFPSRRESVFKRRLSSMFVGRRARRSSMINSPIRRKSFDATPTKKSRLAWLPKLKSRRKDEKQKKREAKKEKEAEHERLKDKERELKQRTETMRLELEEYARAREQVLLAIEKEFGLQGERSELERYHETQKNKRDLRKSLKNHVVALQCLTSSAQLLDNGLSILNDALENNTLDLFLPGPLGAIVGRKTNKSLTEARNISEQVETLLKKARKYSPSLKQLESAGENVKISAFKNMKRINVWLDTAIGDIQVRSFVVKARTTFTEVKKDVLRAMAQERQLVNSLKQKVTENEAELKRMEEWLVATLDRIQAKKSAGE